MTATSAFRTETIACPVCGRSESESKMQAKDRLHGLPGEFRYVQCQACGLLYMNPRIIIEDIPRLYPSDYAPHAVKGNKAVAASVKTEASAEGRMDRFFRNQRTDSRFAPALDKDSRVLDVGCGNGAFLKEMADRYGCRVEGVDLSDAAVKAVETAYGFPVFHGTLTEAAFPDATFDTITAWWYLEHVPDPVPILREMGRILKPGGVCILGVPNTRSLIAKLFGNRWYHLDCPRHLSLYSPRSMREALELAGLKVRKFRFDRTPWGLLSSAACAAGGDGGAARRLRGNFLLRQACLPFTAALGLLGLGDTLIVHAGKER